VQATVGDHVLIHGRHVGEQDRRGEVLEVRGTVDALMYTVRWEPDGHEALFCPGPDTLVEHVEPGQRR
jgi:hypothetical protein